MPLTFRELQSSRPANVGMTDGRLVREWIAYRTDLEEEVYAAALVTADPFWKGFIRQDVALKPAGGGIWYVTVTYGTVGIGGGDQPVGHSGLGGSAPTSPTAPTGTTPLGAGYSFDTTGATAHITQSIQTVDRSVGSPDNSQAIGLTRDSVEGTDVFVPKFEWQRTVHRPVCTVEYLKTLRDLTGTVNNDVFYTFPAETVLYLGASGQFTQGEGWSITHRFSYAPNEINIAIGNGLVVPLKRGHEYLWVAYEEQEVGNRVLQVPVAWYVERVYRTRGFPLLEIG